MAQLTVSAGQSKGTIRRQLFGHFSEHLGRCIYDGLYVGEDSKIRNVNGMRADAVEALRNVKIPVLRWPGGCFADEYHWRDGIGPKEGRKRMVNTNWGGVVEDNSFGTHEFMGAVPPAGLRAVHQRQSGQRHRAGNERVGGIPDQRQRFHRGPDALANGPAGAMDGEILGRGQRKLGLWRQHAAGVLRR